MSVIKSILLHILLPWTLLSTFGFLFCGFEGGIFIMAFGALLYIVNIVVSVIVHGIGFTGKWLDSFFMFPLLGKPTKRIVNLFTDGNYEPSEGWNFLVDVLLAFVAGLVPSILIFVCWCLLSHFIL